MRPVYMGAARKVSLDCATKVACIVCVQLRTRDVALLRGRRDMSPAYPRHAARFGLRVVSRTPQSAVRCTRLSVTVATVAADGPNTYLLTYLLT